MADENSSENASNALDLSALGAFDFTPAWAKGPADDKTKFARFEAREERREERRGDDRKGFGPRKPFSRGPRPEGDRGPRFEGERRPRPEGDRRPRPEGDRGPRPEGERRRDDRGPRRFERPPREFVKPLDVDVRILPGQKTLGKIITEIQKTNCAYPIKRLAYSFLDHPASCVVRVSPRKDAKDVPAFHQCKACGATFLSESDLMAHVVAKHLTDYYVSEEISCEAPAGSFTCVARCGLSGVLLGPPNLHGYDARVREMIRTRFPNMSEADYRARIEMVREPDAVEQWRQSATKKTVFRRKGEVAAQAAVEGQDAAAEVPAAPALDREEAELEFRRTIAAGLVSTVTSVDLTAEAALAATDRAFLYACRDALRREREFPRDLLRALRGAFHHRKLHFFTANERNGQEFVTAIEVKPAAEANIVEDLAVVVKYVSEHTCCTRAEAAEALGAGDEAKTKKMREAIQLLAGMGRLVVFCEEYCGGVLSIPAEHPKYHPPRRRPDTLKPAAPAAEAPAAEAPAAEASAAEAPAEPVADASAAEAPTEDAAKSEI